MVVSKKLNYNLKQYLLYSSIFAVFTEAFFFHFIIDLKLLYLIIILNYTLVFLINKTIHINKYFLIVLVSLLIHALIANIIIGIPPNYALAQIIGISIIGVYYYNFIPMFDFIIIKKIYLKMSLWAAIIAYPMYFMGISFNPQGDQRLCSIFTEPAHYAIVVIPACYYYLKIKNYIPFLIIFITLIISSSSLGYLGIALIFILPNISLKRILFLLISIPFILITFVYIYNEYNFFKLRVDDTIESLNAVNTGKFKEYTNLSSYALLSNVFIANQNLQDHPFGSGIGSHVYVHKNVYFHRMSPPKYLYVMKRADTNANDANSLFTRMASEIGYIGISVVIIFLWHSKKYFLNKKFYLSQGLIIYILLKLFRDGHYFPPEFFFFIWLIYYEVINVRKAQI